MDSRVWLVLLAAVISATPAAAESLPELLKPVDSTVEANLMAKTNFDFRYQRYGAKKFRIVDINWELLRQEGARFTITPFEEPGFEDLAVTVRTQTIDRDPYKDQTQNWVGEIEKSAWLAQGGPRDQVLSLWINTGPQIVSLEVARKVAAETGDAARYSMIPKPSNPSNAPRATTKLDARTISGTWITLPGLKVQLQPIEDDPRYHFVMWVDRDKVPADSHGGPENARKFRELDEFTKQVERDRREASLTEPE